MDSGPAPRWGEPVKFLPVIYALCTIFGLGFVYMFFHCIPLLQLEDPPEAVDEDTKRRGIIELQVFLFATTMVLICYARAFFTHPGTVPDNDPHWQYVPQDGNRAGWTPAGLVETKRTGERRHCKWCGKYKPDRCHHCRPCKTCILKMDHHCPWIYNCVGFWNYKFFFQLLFYAVVDCQLIMWTMMESVVRSIDENDEFIVMLTIIFGETLVSFIGVVLTLFFAFHIWLMLKGMTTIEFCEKSMPKKDSEPKHYDTYDRGVYRNIAVALGPNPLLWLLPVGPPNGDGLYFRTRDQAEAVSMKL